jgi:hypothetical protein
MKLYNFSSFIVNNEKNIIILQYHYIKGLNYNFLKSYYNKNYTNYDNK